MCVVILDQKMKDWKKKYIYTMWSKKLYICILYIFKKYIHIQCDEKKIYMQYTVFINKAYILCISRYFTKYCQSLCDIRGISRNTWSTRWCEFLRIYTCTRNTTNYHADRGIAEFEFKFI